MRGLRFLLLFLLLAAAPPQEEIARLVQDLGSAVQATRDQAEVRLKEIGLPALALLQQAAKSKDEEVAFRARKILALVTQTRLTLAVETGEGKPAADLPIQVTLTRTDGSGRLAFTSPPEAKTDAEGKLRLWERPEGGPATLEPGTYMLHVGAAGYLPLKMEPLRFQGGERSLAIRLERGARVSGTLKFHDGKPAAGVAVGLYPVLEPAQLHRYAEIGNRREVVVDAQGRFAFEPAPEGEYRLLVEGWVEGLKTRILLRRSLLLKEGEDLKDLDVALPEDPGKAPGVLREAVFTGRCVDPSGQPISGHLDFFLDGILGWPEHTGEAKLGPDGSFAALAPAGRHWLSAALGGGKGSAPTTTGPVCLAPGVNPPVTLVMKAGGTLKGTAVDAEGNPVPKADILHYHPGRLEAGTPETSMSQFFQADKLGKFFIRHAMPGTWEIRVTGPDRGLGEPRRITVEDGKTIEGLKLVVPEGCGVRGRVLAADGTPCEGATLIAYAESWDNHAGDPWESYVGATANSGSNGWFEMVLPFEGRWRVVADDEGFRPAASEAFKARAGRIAEGVSIRLEPERFGSIRVKVLDADGKPVPAAQVQVMALHPLRAPVRTDARGEALLDRLPPAAYTALAAKAGYAPGMGHVQLGEDGEAEVTCILKTGSRLSGRVQDAAGRPLADHAVWAWRADFSLRHVEEQVGAASWEAMTDAEGRYAFPHLPPGRLKVMPAPDGKAGAIWTGTVPPNDKAVEGVDFRQTDGVPLTVAVTDPKGKPVANASIEAYPGATFTDPYSIDLYGIVFTDEKGIARLPGLPPGEKVDLIVNHPDQSWVFRQGVAVPPLEAPEAKDWNLAIQMSKGERCEGQIVFTPPAYLGPALRDDVFVIALGPGAGKTRVREDGGFTFERLIPGDYEVFLTVGNRRMSGAALTVKAGEKAKLRMEIARALPASLSPGER